MAAAGRAVDDERPAAPAAAAWEMEDGVSVVAVQLERSRPYGCPLCSKRFLSKSHFTEHQRVHTGERPYPCRQCQRSFTTLHNLKRHQTIHVKEASYRCRKCGVLFCHVHKNAGVRRSLSSDAPRAKAKPQLGKAKGASPTLSSSSKPAHSMPHSASKKKANQSPSPSKQASHVQQQKGADPGPVTYRRSAGGLYHKIAYDIEVVL